MAKKSKDDINQKEKQNWTNLRDNLMKEYRIPADILDNLYRKGDIRACSEPMAPIFTCRKLNGDITGSEIFGNYREINGIDKSDEGGFWLGPAELSHINGEEYLHEIKEIYLVERGVDAISLMLYRHMDMDGTQLIVSTRGPVHEAPTWLSKKAISRAGIYLCAAFDADEEGMKAMIDLGRQGWDMISPSPQRTWNDLLIHGDKGLKELNARLDM